MAMQFFLIFLGTILITRIFLFLKPVPAPTISDFRIHHYMYGLLAIIISLFLHSLILYAIGLGLFVDELTYLAVGGKTHADNYSTLSLCGTALLIIIFFIFRGWIVGLIFP